jgi:hypothetical protein
MLLALPQAERDCESIDSTPSWTTKHKNIMESVNAIAWRYA